MGMVGKCFGSLLCLKMLVHVQPNFGLVGIYIGVFMNENPLYYNIITSLFFSLFIYCFSDLGNS